MELGKNLILRRPRSGRLEGRATTIQSKLRHYRRLARAVQMRPPGLHRPWRRTTVAGPHPAVSAARFDEAQFEEGGAP